MRTTPIPRQKTATDGTKLCRWCEQPVPKGRRTFCGEACVHEAMLRADPGYLRQQTHKRDKGVCADCGKDTDAIKIGYNRLVAFHQRGILAFDRTVAKALKRTGLTCKYDLGERLDGKTPEEIEANIRHEIAQRIEWHQRNEARRAESPAGRYAVIRHPDDDEMFQLEMKRQRSYGIEMPPEVLKMRAVHRRMKRLAEARRKRIAAELNAAGWHGVKKHKAQNLWQADHIHPVAYGGGGCGLENIQTLCTLCHKRKTAKQAARTALIRRGIDPDAPTPPDQQLTLPI